MAHLPNYISYHYPISQQGRKGQGAAIFVHAMYKDLVSLWRLSKGLQAIWLRFSPVVFNTKADVMLGAAYIPPQSHLHSREEIQTYFTDLGMDIYDAQQEACLIILTGDLNAKLRLSSEFTISHPYIVARFPDLLHSRSLQGTHAFNAAGTFLTDMALMHDPLILTTGRGKGDTGQPTCANATRTEHILLHPDLFAKPYYICTMPHITQSDHTPLSITFHDLPFIHGMFKGSFKCTAHTCDEECRKHTNGLKLRWVNDPRRQDIYANLLASDATGHEEFHKAMVIKDLDKAWDAITNMIHRAACHPDVAFYKTWKCPRKDTSNNPHPVWFNTNCIRAKADMQHALSQRLDGQRYRALKRHYRRVVRQSKRAYINRKTVELAELLRSKNPDAYQILRQPYTRRAPTPIDVDTWQNYIAQHFGHAQSQPTPTLNNDTMAHDTPSVSQISASIASHLGKIHKGTATGFDGLPIEFIKFADCPNKDAAHTQNNIFLPLFAELFHTAILTGSIPQAWKAARLSPIYKKGPSLQPKSYRMLAINSIVYRLFANVVKDFTTTWCQTNHKIPDTQFGFYPGRNTLQPMFILHHCIADAKSRHTQKYGSRVYVAFMDFTQAYDSVDRNKLWSHLQKLQVPPYLLNIIKAMYTDDSYVLVDGGKRTSAIHPTKGVKQGCPLSPLLFALYINDFIQTLPPDFHSCGFPLRELGQFISHLFYADDLMLMSRNPYNLQRMLTALGMYSQLKGLTINISKSKVVVFNSRLPTADVFTFDGNPIEIVDEFTYLGMLFHKSGNLHFAEKQWSTAFARSIAHTLHMYRQFGLKRNHLDIMLQLFQTFVHPTSMYASHIWGTAFLQPHHLLTSDICLHHLHFLLKIAGLKHGINKWCIMHEFKQLPSQFFWWRAILKFWNKLLTTNSAVLLSVVKSDLALSKVSKYGWCANLTAAMQTLPLLSADNVDQAVLAVSQFRPVDVTATLQRVMLAHSHLWETFQGVPDFRGQQVHHRKLATYFHCFKRTAAVHKLPAYLSCATLPPQVVHNVLRFRLGAHRLFVERGRYLSIPWERRFCQRCGPSSSLVDDEFHMIFECKSFDNLRSDPQVHDVIVAANGSVRRFCNHPNFQVVAKFLSSCMHIVDNTVINGAEQPNLAEGH
jgi:Reverse transcriptase (RNA-dependent DNA polymerase)